MSTTMICPRCLHRAATRQSFHLPPPLSHSRPISSPISNHRFFNSTPQRSADTLSPQIATQTKPRQTSPSSPTGPPSATSTSAAQPFSTPLTPSPAALGIKASKPKAAVQVMSSVVAGTSLKGLGLLKNKPDPVALEDGEYPGWLWGCLKEKKEGKESGGVGGGDLFSKSKKQRRLAAKQLRKQAIMNPESLAPKIPLQEQSIDLPFNDDGSVAGAMEAMGSREDLTKAMRGKRRSVIKESNFLRGMK